MEEFASPQGGTSDDQSADLRIPSLQDEGGFAEERDDDGVATTRDATLLEDAAEIRRLTELLERDDLTRAELERATADAQLVAARAQASSTGPQEHSATYEEAARLARSLEDVAASHMRAERPLSASEAAYRVVARNGHHKPTKREMLMTASTGTVLRVKTFRTTSTQNPMQRSSTWHV